MNLLYSILLFSILSVFADNKKMLRLLIKNDKRPIDIQFHARADGMDLIKLRKYLA